MSSLTALCLLAAASLVSHYPSSWVIIGIALFVVGWIFQTIGHIWEGRKPAFVDDLVGLLVGPLFVVAEFLFFFKIGKDLQSQIEGIAGPTRPLKSESTTSKA